MIPSPFEYVRARSVEEALAALAEHGEDAKLLAGGHSLLPIMKLRLAIPTVLIDIGSIRELSYVRVDGSGPDAVVAIGAGTRHHVLETEHPADRLRLVYRGGREDHHVVRPQVLDRGL